MTNKEKLARLAGTYDYSNKNSMSLEEYGKTSIAIEIAGDELLIEKLEPFYLPEIIKLICANNKLLNKYADTYASIHIYYIENSVKAMENEFRNHVYDSIYYIEKVFPLIDAKILKNFIDAYEYYSENAVRKQSEVNKKLLEKEKLEKEVKDIDEKINNIDEKDEKFKNDKKSLNSKKTNKTKKLDNLKDEIRRFEEEGVKSLEIKSRLNEAYNVANTLVGGYKDKISAARSKAYFLLDEKNAIKSQIEHYIRTGEITLQFAEELKKNDFLQLMLRELDLSFCEESVHILAELYDNGKIDLYDSVFKEYLVSHTEQLSGYFVSKFIKNNKQDSALQEDYTSWCELVLDVVLSDTTGNSIRDCYIIWKALAEENKWNDFLDILIEKDEERFTENISKFILMTNGYARKSLLNIVQRFIDKEYIESTSALIRELINNHIPGDDCSAIVEYILEQHENELRKNKRNVDRLQFKINKMPGELYGAISDAVESIETLASDIDTGSDKIPKKHIASNLKKNILKLREGLEAVGVYTLVNSDDWLNQKHITFDPRKHSISISTPPQEVYLRTLGFIYSDVEGEKKIVQAKVGRLQELANSNDKNNSSAKKYRRKKSK